MIRKINHHFTAMILTMLMGVVFIACDDKGKSKDEDLIQSQDYLVGKWQCTLDAYGEPWDEPLIMLFDADGTGYQWFSDEPFSDRWEFNYVATSSKVKIITQYGAYDLRYEISSNGKTLILYGWEDKDMEELWFTRMNNGSSDNNNESSDKDDESSNDNDDSETDKPGQNYISTESKIYLNPMKVRLYGFLRGVTKETEVGFRLSLSPDMKQADCRIIKLTSSGGRFDTWVDGILDQETYYYQAYAKVDGKYYYGEVLKFDTDPLTYTINGKEFKVIKIEGGPYGTFSILQTEVSVNDRLVIGGVDLEITLDCDMVDGNISRYESKKYFGNLLKKTGLVWRYPTSSEWQFAAEGGVNGKNYLYSGSDDIESVAWFKDNSIGPRESGLKKPNELNLYDMSGNFAELTNDIPLKLLETQTYEQYAEYYDWSKSKVYGGNWSDPASACTVNSHKDIQWIVYNLIDGRKYAFRLVYSHHIHAYSHLTK